MFRKHGDDLALLASSILPPVLVYGIAHFFLPCFFCGVRFNDVNDIVETIVVKDGLGGYDPTA